MLRSLTDLGRARALLLSGVLIFIAAALLVYSQTRAFAWDEGFHLITAQLILRGKRPYLDFLFPQTLLNAYWNALWMRVFGETWRTAHVVAALGSIAAMLLTVHYVLRREWAPQWRAPLAVFAAITVGLNAPVVQYGTIGQAYGFCLVLIVAAFRFGVTAVARRHWIWAALSGLFAGAAAGSSLLSAPVAPVLFIWMLVYNRAGGRVAKACAFLLALIPPFIPVLWLFAQNPRLTIFNVISYHLFYRQVQWPHAIPHDIDVLMSIASSGQALLLALLAIAGLLYTHYSSGWDRGRRGEMYLCGWLVVALVVHISSAHPTFPRYYLLTTPFLSIVAAAGLYSVTTRLWSAEHPWPSVALIAFVFVLGVEQALYLEREDLTWPYFETVAEKVREVTPPGASLLADEHIYFMLRRVPPTGMELGDSHKLDFSPAFEAWIHAVPDSELRRRLKDGLYATAETCHDDVIQEVGPDVFAQHADMGNCDVYWSPKK